MEYLAALFAHAIYNYFACLAGSCAPLYWPYVPL